MIDLANLERSYKTGHTGDVGIAPSKPVYS